MANDITRYVHLRMVPTKHKGFCAKLGLKTGSLRKKRKNWIFARAIGILKEKLG